MKTVKSQGKTITASMTPSAGSTKTTYWFCPPAGRSPRRRRGADAAPRVSPAALIASAGLGLLEHRAELLRRLLELGGRVGAADHVGEGDAERVAELGHGDNL